MSDTSIAANLYASVPNEERGNLEARALARSLDLTGVPGFYKGDECWQLKNRHKGYYVPCRNYLGRIVGLQIRLDNESKGKYRWLSSKGLPEGTAQSTPLHFAAPDLVGQAGEILITEGALKADIISEYEHAAVVAIAGVNAVSGSNLAEVLRFAFADKLKRVVLAFDMDWKANSTVKNALQNMIRDLEVSGLQVMVSIWDAALGKGLDDALVGAERLVA